jgi:hypothetical protein
MGASPSVSLAGGKAMLRTTQFSVTLPNKRGQLGALSRCLADAKVNIIALSVIECTEAGTVRLVVNKPEAAAAALKDSGLPAVETEVLVAALPNKVGVLADVCAMLSKARVNINFAYGSTGKGRGMTHVVIGCSSMARAEKALADY